MKIAIVGAGASGLFAAGLLNENHNVTLFDKNDAVGKKIMLTGNGRCNVTNLKPVKDFLNNVMTNKEFIEHALSAFSPNDMYNFLLQNNIETLEEEDNKIFPKTGKARGIVELFVSKLKSNVLLQLNTKIDKIEKTQNGFDVCYENKYENKTENFDAVLVATGGKSYAITGSTGDGYEFAKQMGHLVSELRPSLCGLKINSSIIAPCPGVTFNLPMKIVDSKGYVKSEFCGGLMITGFGVSGPGVYKLVSRFKEQDIKDYKLVLDFAFDVSEVELRNNIKNFGVKNKSLPLFEFAKQFWVKRFSYAVRDEYAKLLNKTFKNATQKDMDDLVKLLKSFSFNISDFDDFNRAVVTRGGVQVDEVDNTTMQSKIVNNLYFLGEVLNVDAFTGGYSLQIAFSTAYLAATHLNKIDNK